MKAHVIFAVLVAVVTVAIVYSAGLAFTARLDALFAAPASSIEEARNA